MGVTGRGAEDRVTVRLTVNGEKREAAVEPRLLLSDFLRHDLGLTGTHVGCEHGVCGACTVLLDGQAVRSCLTFAVQARGSDVTTVEGLSPGAGPDGAAAGDDPGVGAAQGARESRAAGGDRAAAAGGRAWGGEPVGEPRAADALALHPLQRAFRDAHGLQCGFCTPGILMALLPFLGENPEPTRLEIRQVLSGHLCRCTGYQFIVDAVELAAERMRGADSDPGATADGRNPEDGEGAGNGNGTGAPATTP